MAKTKKSAENKKEKKEAKKSSQNRASTKKRVADTEEWVSKHINELVSRLGLEFLKLGVEEYISVLTKIVDVVRGESATLDVDTIVKRIKRYSDKVYPILAVSLLELRGSLDEDQLEFVVNSIGEAVLAYAPRLYSEARRLERADLIERLKDMWRHYWVLKRHPILPVACPRCSFNSLMPDLSCLVCGAVVTEGELKTFLNFKALLEDFALREPVEEVKKVVSFGYVYVNSLGIKAPGEHKDVLDVEVLLSNKDKEVLLDKLKQRELQHGG
jgi:hypothetical protein